MIGLFLDIILKISLWLVTFFDQSQTTVRKTITKLKMTDTRSFVWSLNIPHALSEVFRTHLKSASQIFQRHFMSYSRQPNSSQTVKLDKSICQWLLQFTGEILLSHQCYRLYKDKSGFIRLFGLKQEFWEWFFIWKCDKLINNIKVVYLIVFQLSQYRLC